MRDYGLLLKTTREARGLTQEAAAEAVGVSVDSWYAYESNLRLPPMETVPRICEALEARWLAWYFQEAHAGPGNVLPTAKARELMEIAEDGVIDENERGPYETIVDELDGIVEAALAVKFPMEAKKARPDVGASRRTGFQAAAENNRKAIVAQRPENVNTFRRRGGASL